MSGQLDKIPGNKGKLILVTGIVLFFFILISLLMMSDALQNSARFGQYYSVLLLFNTLGLLTLAILIVANIRDLIKQLKIKAPGAKMTFRTVIMFAVLSVTPILIHYYFSLDFLYKGIDSWFDLRVEQALDDSLELSKISLDDRMKEFLKQTEQISRDFAQISNFVVPFEIDDYRLRSGAEELTIMNKRGGFIASSFGNTNDLIPNRPNETILFQLQQGSNYVSVDSISEDRFAIHAVVNIPDSGIEAESRIVQAIYPIADRINILADNVQFAYLKYQELSYLRDQLKLGFIVILTLVLLFSIFSALWATFYFANRLAKPIRDLAEGTKSIAEGDYGKQLSVPSDDELGFLVTSFNEMTRKIATARDEARDSQLETEAQHAYLEAILGRLSSGVLVFDQTKKLRTSNISSRQILGIEISSLIGKSLEEIREDYFYLDPMLNIIASHIEKNTNDWREQVNLFGTSGRQILMCRGTSLSLSLKENSLVHMIVFDDITALIQGQKEAAWSEMARRLAHEIKNPLTPIQLAAERLRHKFLETMDSDQADALNKLTNTIVQQVETMKDMVNTFSEYAYTPAITQKYVDINKVIQGFADLYSTLAVNTPIVLELTEKLPLVKADPGRLQRVFNNLVNNSFDATSSKNKTILKIMTNRVSEKELDFIEIRVKDSGAGISKDIMGSIFEPYVTSKPKGTGLGLAIVKKIIEEHGGIVWIENNTGDPGACAVIRLPVATSAENPVIQNNYNKEVI